MQHPIALMLAFLACKDPGQRVSIGIERNPSTTFTILLFALKPAAGWQARIFPHAEAISLRRSVPTAAFLGRAEQGMDAPWARFLEVVDQYDAVLLDQFGVIHDGKTAYPGAPETVQALLDAGKVIIVLSNSSRRKGTAAAKLAKMGFPPISDIVTSGEAAWNLLHSRPEAPFDSTLGSQCTVFGNGEDDVEYITSAGVSITNVDQADFLFARGLFCIEDGTDGKVYSSDRATGIMARACERGLPMVVANPDFVRPDGKASPMPGVIAKQYEDMGGTVHYVGKPHPLVYQQALNMLKHQGIENSKVAGVGDSLLHDVRGAQQAGIDAVFVASGIHLQELALDDTNRADSREKALNKLFQEYIGKQASIIRPPEHTVYKFADVEA